MDRLKRTLVYVVLVLALFVCVWVSRIFLSQPIVGLAMPLSGVRAVAAVAVVSGFLPGLLLGLAYGLINARPIFWSAFAVALGACAVELVVATLSVNWWEFVTWWVVPFECVALMVSFPAAAWISSRLAANAQPGLRRRCGIAMFALITLGALAWPWL